VCGDNLISGGGAHHFPAPLRTHVSDRGFYPLPPAHTTSTPPAINVAEQRREPPASPQTTSGKRALTLLRERRGRTGLGAVSGRRPERFGFVRAAVAGPLCGSRCVCRDRAAARPSAGRAAGPSAQRRWRAAYVVLWSRALPLESARCAVGFGPMLRCRVALLPPTRGVGQIDRVRARQAATMMPQEASIPQFNAVWRLPSDLPQLVGVLQATVKLVTEQQDRSVERRIPRLGYSFNFQERRSADKVTTKISASHVRGYFTGKRHDLRTVLQPTRGGTTRANDAKAEEHGRHAARQAGISVETFKREQGERAFWI
jgi:hypothetical protein